ncbi:DUF3592 domain-containing protein [Tahibacter amnicola]|uniref:DUF3592 domain-containing protein n=1 Tax=Tahibacter amnicola TaxID=2976241 RepID=A0ABY6BDD7_9GAMM|nr:DUF3592 domain-containing protein [Tahibacter amnicola]UXI68048.1 DUF3592 domain-containing protein [Tahibacter amnicola]
MLGKLKMFLIIAALIIGGPLFIVAGFNESKKMKAMDDHGKTAEAVVESVEWKRKRGSDRSFTVNVQFETEDKQRITKNNLSVSTELGKQLRDGGDNATVQVKYLPEDPHTVIMADHKDNSGFMYGAGAVAFLVGVGILVYRLRKRGEPEAQPA